MGNKKSTLSRLLLFGGIVLLFIAGKRCTSSIKETNRQKYFQEVEEASARTEQRDTEYSEDTSYGSSSRFPENKIVADAMASLRNELPIHLEGLGMVREIDYDGNDIIFRMRIKEDASYGMSVTKISHNQSLSKEIVAAQIGIMNAQEKEAIKAIAGESFGLKVIISGSSSGRDGIINLSSDKIKSAIANAQNKSADDFSLEMVAMTTRLMLPAQVDQVTTWTDTRLTDKTFEYLYRIDDGNIDLSSIDMAAIKGEKLKMLSQNIDVMGNVVSCCRSTHRNLIYRYVGKNSNKTVQVILTPRDLEKVY